MILITGASGKTGRALTRSLADRGYAVRAFIRAPERGDAMLALGATETFVGDMRRSEDVTKACRDVQQIYHIPPNVSADELRMGEIAIAAAQVCDVERFVYHSVMHPQVEKMPHHWEKMRVEERLFESSLNFTILQPAPYMQNILSSWKAIIKQGVYEIPYSVAARLSIVDLVDVVEAASIVLTEPGHEWGSYELGGPQPLSQVEVARILSEELHRPVLAKKLPIEDWKKRVSGSDMGDYAIKTLMAMFEYYDAYGLSGNSHVLESLLGRPAGKFRSFIQRRLEAG